MALARYILRRLAFVLPQLVGILMVSFFLVKLIPGDPAVLMLGPNATPDAIDGLRRALGLDQSLIRQFAVYIGHVFHGDLGTSWQSTRPVVSDLIERFPATLELVTLGLSLALLIGIPLGIAAARAGRGPLRKIGEAYGLLAGAIPDFWLALVLIYVFYSTLHVAPAPLGRLDIALVAPPFVTGSLILDSLLAGDLQALGSALAHLVLPVATLGFINAGPILKMTQSTVGRILASDFIRYAEMCGLPRRVVMRQAIRAALPSIVTIVSVLYGFLIGGAVLVEIVFSWGGAGQYAVQGVLNADINPVLGFVVFSAIFSLIVYLCVDLAYFLLDPRTRG
ncbi:ABC transporter permease [Lichenifustis flavocetrariae]|uniref:ABC transporter permease n=1 Tax=Lichenifustis flavocetrariae TaxID=2949735 RepID=A0AA41YZH7_9HYPH|nr:ABC transporter permease [Lichenifustis flavocetrariae]MCW6510166.1 ABC transporter permease [Lichenifustis flavocetrariae]